MSTINVLDADGNVEVLEKPLVPGRAAAASSRPVALSTEDKAAVDLINTNLTALAGYVDGLEALTTAIGSNTDTLETLTGGITEAAPASDTASSGLNGRLQRIAQRLTSLIALVPTSLGAKTSANSFAVTTATDDVTVPLTGAVNETAPASDTASSGLNGRLQRIAQRLTSLIALVPASLGQKAMSASLAVTVASDQSTFPVSPGASAATGGIASTSRILSAAASTNATSVKASAGRVYAIQGYNASSSVRYLKLYNKASSPTVGTDTPVKTIAIPPSVGFAFDWPLGYSFATGIALALTTGSADADTGALTAGDILGLNVDYI
jgi:hypothetical protein